MWGQLGRLAILVLVRSLIVTAIVLVTSCGSTQRPHLGRVTVRMAGPDEFSSPACGAAGLGDSCFPRSCVLDGQPAPELFEPVVAFARANLVREIDNFTGYPSTKIEARMGDTDRRHGDGYFTELVVQPRSTLGDLAVWQREVFKGHSTWGASITYCMHVTRGATTTTVVLEEIQRLIG